MLETILLILSIAALVLIAIYDIGIIVLMRDLVGIGGSNIPEIIVAFSRINLTIPIFIAVLITIL